MKKMLFNYSVFFMAGVVKPPAWSECVRLHSFARLHVCLGICCHLHSGHDKVARTLLTHHRKCLIMQLLLRSCASCRYRSRTKITSTPIDKLVHLGKAVVAVYKERGMKKGTLVFNDTQMYGKKKTRVCFFTLFFFCFFGGLPRGRTGCFSAAAPLSPSPTDEASHSVPSRYHTLLLDNYADVHCAVLMTHRNAIKYIKVWPH